MLHSLPFRSFLSMPQMPPIIPVSDFLDDLAAFDPSWQKHYDSMEQAAAAAGTRETYLLWLRSGEARKRVAALMGVEDYTNMQKRAMAAQERFTAENSFEASPTDGWDEDGAERLIEPCFEEAEDNQEGNEP